MLIEYTRVCFNRVVRKIINPARGQLNRGNEYFPVPVGHREFGLARQVRPSRPASACSFSIVTLNLVLIHGTPPDFRGGGVHLSNIPPTDIGSVANLSGHAKLRTDGVHCREATTPVQGQ